MKVQGVAVIGYDVNSFTEGANEEVFLKLAVENLVSCNPNVQKYQYRIDPCPMQPTTKGA